MDTIRVIHDVVGHTLAVWRDDPRKEHLCAETTDEVVLMKDVTGRVIGFEWGSEPHRGNRRPDRALEDRAPRGSS